MCGDGGVSGVVCVCVQDVPRGMADMMPKISIQNAVKIIPRIFWEPKENSGNDF